MAELYRGGDVFCLSYIYDQDRFLASIASQSRGSWFDGEFIRTCCYPLILFTENERFLAKTILSARPQRTLPLQTINKSEFYFASYRTTGRKQNIIYRKNQRVIRKNSCKE